MAARGARAATGDAFDAMPIVENGEVHLRFNLCLKVGFIDLTQNCQSIWLLYMIPLSFVSVARSVIWRWIMSIHLSLIAFAAVFAASTSAGYAGPCSQDIARLQAVMDAKLRAVTAAGPRAPESTAATMHRQPTPRSIATAEGAFSQEQVKVFEANMARAREADSANDENACKQAIADAERIFDQ